MDSNSASENLQVIRTLMERSALYRRALAPIMAFNGSLGLAAALVGVAASLDKPRTFILFWAATACVGLAGSFLLVRRQALKDAEPFWSPPTRRVTVAFLPPLVAGFLVGLTIFLHTTADSVGVGAVLAMLWLPIGWVVLYGCALHAAGFFMERGIKVLGWAFIIGGCVLFAIDPPGGEGRAACAHGIMGFFFGALHLAYGVYLYFTEKRKTAA